jgi:peptide/nickel transport system permease protein
METKIAHPMGIRAIWRRFRKNKVALFGGCIVLVVLIMAICAPFISPHDPEVTSPNVLVPPSPEYWFGTDTVGRDVLSRCIWGARPSLVIGLVASFVITLIGAGVGAFSGYYGGIVDSLLMRVTDTVLVIPTYFFYILIIAAIRDRSILTILVLMAVLGWPTVARMVRSEFLLLREMDYVRAAKTLGANNMRIIFRHLLPNAVPLIIVVTTMNIASVILTESALGFLGLTDPTIVGWGNILADGRGVLRSAWWISTFPGVFIFLTVLGFNLLGDGLRDALDPRMRGTI